MKFATAVRTVLFKKYATFSGRASRSEYWWWTLAVVLASLVVSLIDAILFPYGLAGATPGAEPWSSNSEGPLSLVFGLAVLLPSFAVSIRRLHDVDKSGWWILIILVPLIGSLYLIYLYVLRGTAGPNRFGNDPLGSDALHQGPQVNPQQPNSEPGHDPDPTARSARPPSTGKGRRNDGFQTTQDRFKDQ